MSFTLDLPTISDDVLILDGTIEEDGALRGAVYEATRRWARVPAKRPGLGVRCDERGDKSRCL